MNSASDNYISDVVYGSRYNQYLNPLNLHYIALHAGLRKGKLVTDFSYCDLGCGDGTTLNIIASMYPDARFYGVDFNGEHISAAQTRAKRAGLDNVEYHQLDFAQLDAPDFPKMDFITCLGTYSWINRSLQDRILGFSGESLVDQGVFLVHYAAKPGKAQIDPLWHLLRTATHHMAGSSKERVRKGVEIITLLKSKGARFFEKNPVALARTNALPGQDLNYLAHETLTEWQAFHHTEIANRALAQGLRFAGLANPGDNDPEFTIPEAFRPVLDKYADPDIRTTIEDYILNRGLRTDIYVKSLMPAPPGDPEISHQPMLLTSADGNIAGVYKTASGRDILFQAPVYQAIEAELRTGAHTVTELHDKPALNTFDASDLVSAISRLVASEQVKPVIGNPLAKPGSATGGDYQPALKMTSEILGNDIQVAGLTFLPSPLTGQCVPVDQLIALCLSALLHQHDDNARYWVAGQIRKTGVAGIQGTATKIKPKQVDTIVSQAMQATTDMVLPALVRLGVYLQAGK